MTDISPQQIPWNPGSTIPPELAQALADAQARLHLWQEEKSKLARLNFPNQVAVAQVNSEIMVAQADVDEARDAIIAATPKG